MSADTKPRAYDSDPGADAEPKDNEATYAFIDLIDEFTFPKDTSVRLPVDLEANKVAATLVYDNMRLALLAKADIDCDVNLKNGALCRALKQLAASGTFPDRYTAKKSIHAGAWMKNSTETVSVKWRIIKPPNSTMPLMEAVDLWTNNNLDVPDAYR